MGRPETNWARRLAMNVLGNGLHFAGQYADALSVKQAKLAMERRLGADEDTILGVQANLAMSYGALGHREKALSMERDVYSGRLKLNGEEDSDTLSAGINYALSLGCLGRFEEARSLLRKTMPVARRVLGESNETTLRMRWIYAEALYRDDATLDDLREAVNTLEETERTARRVFGGAHPITAGMGKALRKARAALRAREEAAPDDVSSVCKGVAAMTPPGDA